MVEKASTFKGIKDLFYETRVLMGRSFTLKRFSEEVLEAAVDPVMLSYIEKGKRFPTEPLVRKLAAIRKQDPKELLILLWQDRMLHAFSRELRKVIKTPKPGEEKGIGEADIAFLMSRAIAALPDDGNWIPVTRWMRENQKALQEIGKKRPAALLKEVVDTLKRQGVIEHNGDRVRRVGRHFVPDSPEQKRSLAMEFCGIFAKGLLEKVVRQERKTYVRNHYLHIPDDRIEEFHKKLDQAVQQVVKEFVTDDADSAKFINVLMTSTRL